MTAGMDLFSPSLLPSPDLRSVKVVRKRETEWALDISGDVMIKPRPSLTCVK